MAFCLLTDFPGQPCGMYYRNTKTTRRALRVSSPSVGIQSYHRHFLRANSSHSLLPGNLSTTLLRHFCYPFLLVLLHIIFLLSFRQAFATAGLAHSKQLSLLHSSLCPIRRAGVTAHHRRARVTKDVPTAAAMVASELHRKFLVAFHALVPRIIRRPHIFINRDSPIDECPPIGRQRILNFLLLVFVL